jgi:16S rRNA (guanine966-N2)-methyltransferase
MSGRGYQQQVRIIGGQWRRRQLRFADLAGLRPTTDRVRETLFNWLGQDLSGQTCLDLFAGSGALGFEAASRYAAQVVLVEMARPAQQQLAANIRLLEASNIRLEAGDALAYARQTQQTFDGVFLDPPFASTLLQQVLPLLPRLVRPHGWVYVEAPHLPAPPAGWEVLRTLRAGQVQAQLWRVPAPPADAA